MASRLDPNVPPHKTKPFWYIVALGVVISVSYPLLAGSHGDPLSDVVPSVVTFAMLVCVAWFAVRRAQRGQTAPPMMRVIVLIIIGIILLILSHFLPRHP